MAKKTATRKKATRKKATRRKATPKTAWKPSTAAISVPLIGKVIQFDRYDSEDLFDWIKDLNAGNGSTAELFFAEGKLILKGSCGEGAILATNKADCKTLAEYILANL